MAWTGLRWVEAVALRRSSLDLLRHRIKIVDASTEVNGELIPGVTKTHRSRTVVIPRSVTELVAAHLDPGRA